MYKIKHISKLGNDIAYGIEYETLFKTYDITIYHDEVLKTWDGAMCHGNTVQDIGSDMAATIINELLIQTYKGVN